MYLFIMVAKIYQVISKYGVTISCIRICFVLFCFFFKMSFFFSLEPQISVVFPPRKVSPSKFNVITSQKVRTVFRTVRVVCFTLLMTKTINIALLREKTYKQL